jgi:3-methylfumaryl-CoA hydratase
MTLDTEYLRSWIGRQETATDHVAPARLMRMAATLDRDDPPPRDGDPLPPLWHWTLFLPHVRQSQLGPDGHPKRGDFLPAVDLPRRLWAGGRLRFIQPLRVSERVTRTSTIADVSVKEGRAGTLVFVLVRHVIEGEDGPAIEEEHDIVYRGAPTPGEPPTQPRPARIDAAWARTVVPDDVLLFRYSALTFNSFRIHYDRRYATEVEGYPGLVVHAPLMATMLLDLVRRNSARAVQSFRFRALAPVFDTAPFHVRGEENSTGASLWIAGDDGGLRMEAEAVLH